MAFKMKYNKGSFPFKKETNLPEEEQQRITDERDARAKEAWDQHGAVGPDGKKGINLRGGAGDGLGMGGGGEVTHYVFHYNGVNSITVDGTGFLNADGTVALTAGTTFR